MDAELFFAADAPASKAADGLIWKTICRTGTWKMNPLDKKKPLVLDKPFFDDLVTAYKDNAWEHVTVPLSHRDELLENTGFVRNLEVPRIPSGRASTSYAPRWTSATRTSNGGSSRARSPTPASASPPRDSNGRATAVTSPA